MNIKKENNTVIASEVITRLLSEKKIFSEKIIYYKNKNVIKTFKKSKFTNGEYEQILETLSMIYNLKTYKLLVTSLLIDKIKMSILLTNLILIMQKWTARVKTSR